MKKLVLPPLMVLSPSSLAFPGPPQPLDVNQPPVSVKHIKDPEAKGQNMVCSFKRKHHWALKKDEVMQLLKLVLGETVFFHLPV